MHFKYPADALFQPEKKIVECSKYGTKSQKKSREHIRDQIITGSQLTSEQLERTLYRMTY